MFARINGFDQSLTKDFMHLENQMDRLFEAAGVRSLRKQSKSVGQPPLNVAATSEQVDIYVAIAGIDPNAVAITLDKNQMSISGCRSDTKSEEVNALKKERFTGEYKYLVTLPDDVEPDGVEANYQNGVLHISVKRRVPAKPRQITVQ